MVKVRDKPELYECPKEDCQQKKKRSYIPVEDQLTDCPKCKTTYYDEDECPGCRRIREQKQVRTPILYHQADGTTMEIVNEAQFQMKRIRIEDKKVTITITNGDKEFDYVYKFDNKSGINMVSVWKQLGASDEDIESVILNEPLL
jgi:hypothetical protein